MLGLVGLDRSRRSRSPLRRPRRSTDEDQPNTRQPLPRLRSTTSTPPTNRPAFRFITMMLIPALQLSAEDLLHQRQPFGDDLLHQKYQILQLFADSHLRLCCDGSKTLLHNPHFLQIIHLMIHSIPWNHLLQLFYNILQLQVDLFQTILHHLFHCLG